MPMLVCLCSPRSLAGAMPQMLAPSARNYLVTEGEELPVDRVTFGGVEFSESKLAGMSRFRSMLKNMSCWTRRRTRIAERNDCPVKFEVD
jgi:hypothetical protein